MLVDYYSWACENAIEYDAVGNYACSLDHIKEIIKEKDISLHQGDIIFIRTGKQTDFSPGPSALCPRQLTSSSLRRISLSILGAG